MSQRTALVGKFAGLVFVLTAGVASAQPGIPISATFNVAFTASPNTGGTTYCGGTPLAAIVEAHGVGTSLTVPMFIQVNKTLTPGGAMHGCVTLTMANGDTLNATYEGTIALPDGNNFSPFSGSLTFTGGTGQFRNATGTATFTAWASFFYPTLSFLGGTSLPVQGTAFYLVQGSVSLGH